MVDAAGRAKEASAKVTGSNPVLSTKDCEGKRDMKYWRMGY